MGTVVRELDLRCARPWRFRSTTRWQTTSIPGARCLYAVRAGDCEILQPGRPGGLHLATGDVVILPRGESHLLRSSTGPWPDPVPLASTVVTSEEWTRKPRPDETRLVCGTFTFSESLGHPAISGLPTSIVLRTHAYGSEHRHGWLALLDEELHLPLRAADLILERLTDLLVLEGFRAPTWALEGPGNWLRAAADPFLAPVLERLHRDPARRWTVAQLASDRQRTRAPFSVRFRNATGVTPGAYLHQLRIHHAKKLLAGGRLGLADVARDAGFGSARSFRRAFLRATGISPSAFRRGSHPPR